MLINTSNLKLNGRSLPSLIFEGASGSIGYLTFRQWNGNTIVYQKKKKESPAKKSRRQPKNDFK
ncbi:hypothetical protein [Chitinophaga ginsengisoli]|uniref:Uncharacterized protein n=1 Tax=Chitinophaga ginsengisoli TaxID=363837 RepID=A0A2P8GKY8_9BACT|nr:hypothetical protein [Chitinophaga ginsengisoli]PSL34637.1 hypothetical protein CLV42_102210 [Chitinophaga ginsengisoli]